MLYTKVFILIVFYVLGQAVKRHLLVTEIILENYKKSIEIFYQTIKLMMENIKFKTISSLLKYSKQHLRSIVKKINSKAKASIESSSMCVGGPGIIVEIDESKFGKRKYNRGHRVEGVWVLGLVERTVERKILFVLVKNRKKETLTTIIRQFVYPGSIVYTDCWKGYTEIHKYYEHHTVNHSIGFKDPISGIHTNTIEEN